ncbi:hypothetical protein ABMC88_06605 [Sulfitobacter sp. HNIBRBA2951]|uniref:hypothetical protein n=1 Tax=Sulfitobacter aquimarinus TaxID=3158557 RepID=UPI0032DFADD8
MTGPFGYVAYFNSTGKSPAQFPALNIPECDFARAGAQQAANSPLPPRVVALPRQTRRRAAIAMFGTPERRKN